MEDNSFLAIGITTPRNYISPDEEAAVIVRYLQSGAIDFFHIRKNETPREYVESLIECIPQEHHHRLTLHSHFDIFSKFNFGGLHLKGNSTELALPRKLNPDLRLSRSCHSLEEIKVSEHATPQGSPGYFFLSPIYDSISKEGYRSNFSLDNNLKVLNESHRVVALGGIKPDFFANLFDVKFAGAALLGYLWSPKPDIETKIRNLLEAKNSIKNY